jgi:hypothetical protein
MKEESLRESNESVNGWNELNDHGFWVSPNGQRITLCDDSKIGMAKALFHLFLFETR